MATAQVGQANSAAASFMVNGLGAAGLRGPFPVILSSGPGVLTLDFSGQPLMPFILLGGPANPANGSFGCVGTADIGTPPLYLDIFPIFDGTAAAFPGPLYHLNASGAAHFQFTIPPGLTTGPLVNLQALILQPAGSPCGFVLTAAFYLYVL
jgi:hypothetical protein